MKSEREKEPEQFKKILLNTTSSDFDGHTEFNRLTPEEKLLWLSQCAQFAVEAILKDRN